jgi:hypothetical protein
MASAAMIHFGLDPGKFVHFLSGEYTGQHWDVHRTLDAIQDHVTTDNYGHIKRILLDGCPAQLTFEEPLSNKLELISCGNSKSFVENPQLVQKTMNKEDRYSHLVPMDLLLCKLSPYLRHTMQSIVIKDGKNAHIVWDGCEDILTRRSLCGDSAFAHKKECSIFKFPEQFSEISCRDITIFSFQQL